jgi:hypothetical protein
MTTNRETLRARRHVVANAITIQLLGSEIPSLISSTRRLSSRKNFDQQRSSFFHHLSGFNQNIIELNASFRKENFLELDAKIKASK